MNNPDIRERLSRRITAEEYEEIRRLWIDHSKAEDGRDLEGLVSTLAPNCVYEMVQTGHRWEGHSGARSFYTDFLSAFPDVTFDLQEIVIGPQGVFEEAVMTGTRKGVWLGAPADNQILHARVMILFPWDRQHRRFAGEKIWMEALKA